MAPRSGKEDLHALRGPTADQTPLMVLGYSTGYPKTGTWKEGLDSPLELTLQNPTWLPANRQDNNPICNFRLPEWWRGSDWPSRENAIQVCPLLLSKVLLIG